jgi:hypothetical protein
MKGHTHGRRCLDQLSARFHRHTSVVGESTNNDTLGSPLSRHLDIPPHSVDFSSVEVKITGSWSNQHVNIDFDEFPRSPDRSGTRRYPANTQCPAQFDTMGAPLLSDSGAGGGVDAHFIL